MDLIDPRYAAAGAFTGFLVGLTGVGGGSLMTPILLLVFGVAPVTAVATDLWFAVVTKLVGACFHYKAGQVDWQVAKRLWMGSLPMAFCTVAWIALDSRVTGIGWLGHAIGAIVVLTAAGLLFAPALQVMARTRRIRQPITFKAAQPAMTVVSGAILGICVALTSIGAGALGAVTLVYLYPLRMTPHRLVATDLVHAIPLAIICGLGYLGIGMVDTQVLGSLLSGSIPAVVAASRFAARVNARTLQVLLALLLLPIGIRMLALL